MKKIIAYKLSCLKEQPLPITKVQLVHPSKRKNLSLLDPNLHSWQYRLENQNYQQTCNRSIIRKQKPSRLRTEIEEQNQADIFFKTFQQNYDIKKNKVTYNSGFVKRNLSKQFESVQTNIMARQILTLNSFKYNEGVPTINFRLYKSFDRNRVLNSQSLRCSPKKSDLLLMQQQASTIYPKKYSKGFRTLTLIPIRKRSATLENK